MEISGKVIEKLPIRRGEGARGPWAIAQLVVEFMDGQYPVQVCLQNSKEADKFNAISVGATGTFSFSVSSRKSNQGAWFTSCTCYKWAVQDDLPADAF